MITLGIALVIVGFVAKVAALSTIGVLLLAAGLIVAFLGSTGRPVGGHRHYF